MPFLRVAGDLLGDVDARRWGGLLNVAAVALFLASTVTAITQGPSLRGEVVSSRP